MSDVMDSAVTAAPEEFSAYEAWRAGGTPLAEPAEEAGSVAEASAGSAPAAEAGEDVEDETDEPKKGKGGFQRRIDRLTREKAELQERLQAMEAGAKAPVTGDGKAAETPKGPERPKAEAFDDYDAYMEALVEWKADQKVSERLAADKAANAERVEQEQRQAKVLTFAERAKAAAAKFSDFDAVAYSDDVPVSAAMRDVILESEKGPELAYWLGKHPEDAARIAALSPVAAGREMGRIEASLADEPPKPKKVSKAPEPLKPVSGSAAPRQDVHDEELASDFSAWERVRLAQMKRR